MGKCKELVDARSKSNPTICELIANFRLPIADLVGDCNWQLALKQRIVVSLKITPKAVASASQLEITPKAFASASQLEITPKAFASVSQLEITPKAFANCSPGLERSDNPGLTGSKY